MAIKCVVRVCASVCKCACVCVSVCVMASTRSDSVCVCVRRACWGTAICQDIHQTINWVNDFMSTAHRTHFLGNTLPPPSLQHLPLSPLLLSALATGADNWPVSLGKGVRHAPFGLSSSVRLKLPSHPVAAAEAGRGSGRWGEGAALQLFLWLVFSSIHPHTQCSTLRIRRVAAAAAAETTTQLSHRGTLPLSLLLLLLFLLQLDLNHPSVRHCATSCLVLPLLFGRRFSPAFPRLALGTSIILASPRLTWR